MGSVWSKSEDDLLRKLAPNTTLAEAAVSLNRTRNAVRARASKLEIRFRSPLWYTEDEWAKIRALAPRHTVAEAAVVLNRLPDTLRQRASAAGIKFRKQDRRGIELNGRMAKGPNNPLARPYSLLSPEGTHYRGKNILQFVREHPDLFDKGDVDWTNGGCHAAKKLRSLRPGLQHSRKTWKGWTWGPRRRQDGRGHWPRGTPRSTLTVAKRATVTRKLRRLAEKQSIREIARLLGVSDRSIRRILKGDHQPSPRMYTLVTNFGR